MSATSRRESQPRPRRTPVGADFAARHARLQRLECGAHAARMFGWLDRGQLLLRVVNVEVVDPLYAQVPHGSMQLVYEKAGGDRMTAADEVRCVQHAGRQVLALHVALVLLATPGWRAVERYV